VLTLSERIGDQGEMDKRGEHYVELLEAGEDPAEALEAAEQSHDFVAPLVDRLAVTPSSDAGGLGRHDRCKSQVEGQLPGFIALVGSIHYQMHRAVLAAQLREQLATFGRIVRLAGREGESYCRSSIRGNHMNLGCPSASGLADGLGAVFFSAPVPSGCTLTTVLSRATDSILMRTI